MKKSSISWLLICLLVIAVLPLSVWATDTYISSNTNSGERGAQPTPEATPAPTFEINPSMSPITTISPTEPLETMPPPIVVPTIQPRPDYEFQGPDTNGFWRSGYYSIPKLTPTELKSIYDEVSQSYSTPAFTVWPEYNNEPYEIGQLSADNLEKCLNYFNFLRLLGGLNDVPMSDEANYKAQVVSWIMAHNNSLTHFPACLIGVPSEWCEIAYYAAQESNVAMTTNIMDFIQYHLDGYMSDWQTANVDNVGHRQEILNPRLVDTGFGSAGRYHANYVGNHNIDAQIEDYDFIAWPASGNFPSDTNAFVLKSPWSVSFDRSAIANPQYDYITITVDHNGIIVDELTLNVDPNFPSSVYSPTRFITLEMVYANTYCFVFRPDLTAFNELDGIFTITINGLKHKYSGEEFEVKYQVNFFKLSDVEPIHGFLAGDADCNGTIDGMDALLVMRHTIGLIQLEGQGLVNADYNQDGRVDGSDALAILRKSMGLIQ